MHDTSKTKAQLIQELENLRLRVAALEASQAAGRKPTRQETTINVIEALADPLILFDADGKFAFLNHAMENMSGYTRDEFIGKYFEEMVEPLTIEGERQEVHAITKCAIEKGHTPPFEFTWVTKDGRQIQVSATASVFRDDSGKPSGLVVTYRDMTDLKRMEKTLRESEQRFRLLIQSSSDITALFDEDGTIRYVSPAIEPILGYRPEELSGQPATAILHPEDKRTMRTDLERWLKTPDGSTTGRYRYRHKDGSWRTLESVANNCLENPAIRAIVVNSRDVTERKRLQERLLKSEELYRLTAQNSPDVITIINPDGSFRYISPAAERLLGYTPEEVIEHMGFDHVHPEDRAPTLAAYARLLENPDELLTCRYRLRRKDGSYGFVEAVGRNVLANPAVRAIILNVRDITDRKKMEEVLEKKEHLESLSILCGGIAHDFNNILTAVLTNISMARMYGGLEEDIEKMLADAEKASLRGKGLTQQLLTFAKGGEPIKRALSIATLLKETIDFILSGSNARCEHDLPEDLWHVEADEGQVGQVIQNVILNADQAMPGGGVIQVRAENVTIPEHDPLPLEPGPHVKISIIDQGIGIPEEHLKKVFDPFFTTKQKGSGLGLSTSFSIVKRHNGALQVESRLGGGTKIHVYLPALPEGRAKRGARRDASYRGDERVLLIDDDETLRRSIGKALDRLGYHVEHACEGAEGIAVYQKARTSGRPIDVIVMDLTIPGGMGGKEAARELLRIDPDAKLIVSSGYSTDPVMSDFRAHGFRAVISKPYRIEDLGETLRNVLNEEQT